MSYKTWKTLVERETEGGVSFSNFMDGINVWIERPHIINRKLLTIDLLGSYAFAAHDRMSKMSLSDEFRQVWKHFSTEFKEYFSSMVFFKDASCSQSSGQEDIQYILKFRNLVPRHLNVFSDVVDAIVIDEAGCTATFWPNDDVHHSKITPTFPYRFKLGDDKFSLAIYTHNSEKNTSEIASEKWLKECVFHKVYKWCCKSSTQPSSIPSLNLVPGKNYSVNYNYLKQKYAKKYIEIWPECSDPNKYVYEDISIAAYLMTLWEIERSPNNFNKQKFVDLGCGNGLLVDILAAEGYPGLGIDVRRRKIWDLYEPHTVLSERAIEPSDYNLFPNYDWIIGNHSDELTPWIPVIAARSSFKMKVFLLPCCSFTFNGKYERSHPGTSQYQSYLAFIQNLCEVMGFEVQEDKMRIPSTKRVCFICTSRTYKEEEENKIDNIRKEFITRHSKNTEKISSSIYNTKSTDREIDDLNKNFSEDLVLSEEKHWISDFRPREHAEVVKNCSQLDKNFLEETKMAVANILLETENFISLKRGSEKMHWNAGGQIRLDNLIKLIDPSILKNMKNQCGGFQTFLRNYRNIFTITDGEVRLSVPSKYFIEKMKAAYGKRKKTLPSFKEKPCFFFFHHPQGCPLEAPDCNFCHMKMGN